MTLKEAADILGITPDSLRQAIARGSMKARKVGRDWWVTPSEVERYRTHRRAFPPLDDDCYGDPSHQWHSHDDDPEEVLA